MSMEQRVNDLERILSRLVSAEELSTAKTPDALAGLLDEARTVLERRQPSSGLTVKTVMNAYSYATDDEKGDEFPVELSINGSSGTVQLGEGDDGLTIMFEVRDSLPNEILPHGDLWIGVAPKGADCVLTAEVDLKTGEVHDMETNNRDLQHGSMSPLPRGGALPKP